MCQVEAFSGTVRKLRRGQCYKVISTVEGPRGVCLAIPIISVNGKRLDEEEGERMVFGKKETLVCFVVVVMF